MRVRSCTKPTTSPPIGPCQRRTSRPSAIRTDTGCDAAPNASAASRVSSQPDCQATVRNKIVRWPRRLGIPGGRDGRGGRLRTTPPLRRPRPTSTRPTKIPAPAARPSGRPRQFPALRHHPGQNLRRRPTRPPNRKPGWRRPPAVLKICFAFRPFLETRGLWSSFFYLMLHIVRSATRMARTLMPERVRYKIWNSSSPACPAPWGSSAPWRCSSFCNGRTPASWWMI